MLSSVKHLASYTPLAMAAGALRPKGPAALSVPSSRAVSAVPTIHYFGGFRGRAEAIKLALASRGVQWQLDAVTGADVKADPRAYKFAQCPRYSDDLVDICQQKAILRHVARRWDLYGASLAESARVDEWLEGCETLRGVHFPLVYGAWALPATARAPPASGAAAP